MMKHSIIRRSDAETQRTRTHKQPRAGRWPMVTLAGLMLAALTVPPAWSAVTAPPTGPINGTVPFLKTAEPERSRLYVADQDGNTVGTTPENSIVNKDHTPSSFKASTTETLDIFPDDLDGDCDTTGGFRLACDVAVGGTTNRAWKYNGNLLDAVMLSSPFKTYFSGKTLTVTVTAPVTTTSHTGAPTVGTNPLSSDETLVYVPTVPGIYTDVYPGVNNYYWSPTASTPFPTTAALGLRFTYFLGDGIQGNFTFSTNQPSWTSINPAGVVTITAAPTSATKTVTITATQIAAPHAKQTYTFTVNKWFDVASSFGIPAPVVNDSPRSYANKACAVLGSGWQGAGYQTDIRGPGPASFFRRVPGALMAEWGSRMTPQGWGGGNGLERTGYVYAPTVGLSGLNSPTGWDGVIDWNGIDGLYPAVFNPPSIGAEASISPDGFANVAGHFTRAAYVGRLKYPQTGEINSTSRPYIACVKGV